LEFIEAPAFTRQFASYLKDDEYRELQNRLAAGPEVGDLMAEHEDFGSFAGLTRGEAREEEADYR